jgi:hypothetical protein
LILLSLASAAGAARIRGTDHADRLQTVNRVRDVVSCGRGRDLATVDLLDRVAPDCEVVTREISRDPYRNPASRHETEVEPDSFAVGSTVVAVFQVGRFFSGGAANIGFAVSRDRGRTWRRGLLPGLTAPGMRPTDPTIAFDARHRVWLAVSMVFGTGSFLFAVNRSSDGRHWSEPVTARLAPAIVPVQLDKPWIGCDNWPQSPFRGRCYLTYSDVAAEQIATQVSADGGLTWSAPVSGPGSPGRASIRGAYAPGVQVAVRPDGRVLIPYFDETQLSEIHSADGGATWSSATVIAPAAYAPHRGLRAGPLPSSEVDGAGTIYLAWADCSLRPACAANDLLVARSADGVSWSAPVQVPTRAPDAELPGLAADPSSTGRLGLAYYILRGGRRLDVAFVSSAVGGTRWSAPRRLSSRPFPLGWVVSTSQGSMVGDYISTSFAGGRAVPVFALAARPHKGTLRESIFATSLATPR